MIDWEAAAAAAVATTATTAAVAAAAVRKRYPLACVERSLGAVYTHTFGGEQCATFKDTIQNTPQTGTASFFFPSYSVTRPPCTSFLPPPPTAKTFPILLLDVSYIPSPGVSKQKRIIVEHGSV